MQGEFPSILLEQAVSQMASLPGVGRKTALRYTLALLRRPEGEVEAFSSAFSRLRQEVRYCTQCHNISDTDVCPICASHNRNHNLICVVENIRDVLSIERTGQYNGVYHVLGGIISPIDGIGPQDLQIDSLIQRVSTLNSQPSSLNPQPSSSPEIILALPTTLEGDTTNFYIFRRLQSACPSVRVTQIARGVAIGNDLEYTDEITLGRSILNRTEFKA